jgi:V/A-type H+/Na+-transporting ATPase subunit I
VTLRPGSTRWFEALVLKRDISGALDCLARTGAVQLESKSADPLPNREQGADLGECERIYERLRERYGAYWPEPKIRPLDGTASLDDRMARMLSYLQEWAADADGTVQALQASRQELRELSILRELFECAGDEIPHIGDFLSAGPHLKSVIARLPRDAELQDPPPKVLLQRLQGTDADFVLAIGPAPAMWEFSRSLDAMQAETVEFPEWVAGEPHVTLSRVGEKYDATESACRGHEAALEQIGSKHGLPEALGEIRQLQWLGALSSEIGHTPRLARISGWTLESEISRLLSALDECGILHVLAFPEPPKGCEAPAILMNPPWVRHFEVLTRMLGMPASSEADPSVLVAVIAPVLFGFMFGDVGQGFVLVLAGLALRKRYPPLSILIPGGVMAMIFGLLFGSVFALEDILPALWLHPFDDPIQLLLVSIVAGAVILSTGLILNALQMQWRGDGALWRKRDAGLLVIYAGLLAAPFFPAPGLAAAAAGVLWFLAGCARTEGWRDALRGLGELVETVLQLGVNTVSFARAGAFALAHAGLSAAVVGLADASGPVFFWVVLVLGNGFVLALEGLVVSIQTTRLMLFEFFIRFLRASGREFRPLRPPNGQHNLPGEAT